MNYPTEDTKTKELFMQNYSISLVNSQAAEHSSELFANLCNSVIQISSNPHVADPHRYNLKKKKPNLCFKDIKMPNI